MNGTITILDLFAALKNHSLCPLSEIAVMIVLYQEDGTTKSINGGLKFRH